MKRVCKSEREREDRSHMPGAAVHRVLEEAEGGRRRRRRQGTGQAGSAERGGALSITYNALLSDFVPGTVFFFYPESVYV